MVVCDETLVQERHNRKPGAERERARLGEEQTESSKRATGGEPGKALDRRQRKRCQARRRVAQPREPAAVVEGAEEAGGEEQPDDLAAGDDGRGADDRGDRPEQQVVRIRRASKLVGG